MKSTNSVAKKLRYDLQPNFDIVTTAVCPTELETLKQNLVTFYQLILKS